jgi:hypothetical protein
MVMVACTAVLLLYGHGSSDSPCTAVLLLVYGSSEMPPVLLLVYGSSESPCTTVLLLYWSW